MKVTKKLLSVLLAVIMIMSSMSVCFGTISFTAAAADDTKFETFANALKNSSDVLAQVYNKDFGSYGNTAATGSAGSTNNIVNTTTLTVNTYHQYATLKNLVALFHEAIMASEEIGKTGSGDAATRTCTSATHMYTEFEKKLPKYGCTMTEPVVYFLKLVLDDSKARQHDDYEEKRKPLLSNPSSSTTPANHTNTLIIKAKDEAYKGYLDSIGAYTNVESTIDLGVKYVFAMTRGYYTSKSGLTTYWRFHNYVQTPPSAPAYNQNSNTAAKTTVDAHAAAINAFTSVSFDDLLAKVNNGTIDTFLSDFDAAVASTQTYVGGASTYSKLFGSFATAVATQKASIQSAKDMQEFLPIVENYKNFIAANPSYGVFSWGEGGGANNWGAFGEKGSATHAKMEADYLTFMGYYDALVAGGTVLDYFVNNGDIDMNYLYNFTDNYQVYYLNDSRNAADNFYNTYKDTYKDYETVEQQSLYSEISGYINAIGTYRSNARGGELQVINAVYSEGYVYLLDLQEELKCEINEYVLYFAENAHKSFVGLKTEDVYAKIQEVKEQKLGLDEFYNTLTYARRDLLLGQIRTDADNMLDGLYRLLADRFTAQVNAVDAVYNELERPTTLDMMSYLKLKAVVVPLEDGWDKLYHAENYDDDATNNKGKSDGIQDYLNNEGKGSYISADTMNTYNAYFDEIYYEYCRYATTFGFADYEQTVIDYEDRDVYPNDEVRKDAYEVTEQNLLNLVNDLDTIITSDLVGSLINEDGSALDIGALLSDTVKGFLFKDDFINTFIQLLYPLVLNEFTKAFSNLPSEASGMKVTYNKDFYTVCKETGLELYPDLLAGVLDETKYPETVAMLKAAGGYDDSWTSVHILDTETGKLKFVWGIDEIEDLEEREAKFYEVFADAAEGIKPLLTALITNINWEPDSILQFAHALVLNVTLDLGAYGNPGYANTLVPIYELLGVPYTPVASIEGNDDIAYVLKEILKPIFTFLETLGEKPVDTILGILPNLVYALAFGMVKPLLNNLTTKVWYKAGVIGGGAVTVVSDGVDIFLGDILITSDEGALLPESMFAGGINSLLSNFGLELPAIDQTTLATLGKLTKVSTGRKAAIYSGVNAGEAYTIVADKAGVGYYLLSYILNAVKDEAALTSLLGLFMTQKDENGVAIKDANGKTIPDEEAIAGLKKVIYEDLNLDEMDVGDVIAAIVELANQTEYPVGGYYWYDGSKGTQTPLTPADEIYLSYDNDWTEGKAEYLYDNLDAIVSGIIKTIDAESTFDIEDELASKINALYSNANLTALAKLLAGLDLNALLAGDTETAEEGGEAEAPAFDINALLKDELGIDLAVFAQYKDLADDYNWGFEDGNGAAFGAKLVQLLAPFRPAIDFIFAGKDLTLIDSAITLQGYKGYDNAIVPLLEALGCDNVTALGENEDALAKLVDALITRLARLTNNKYNSTIKDMLDSIPGVIYYLASDGLSQGVDKLLTPVYAVLDTIRPLFDINLAEMIKTATESTGLNIDLKHLDINFVVDLLYKLLGLDIDFLGTLVYDVCKHIGVEYDSASTLNSTWKKGAFHNDFEAHDLLTVILSYVLEWGAKPNNAAALDKLIGTDIISKLEGVFADLGEFDYAEPNWYYWFDSQEALDAYIATGAGLPNTLYALEYPNDWTEEKAQYIADNLPELADLVIGLINKDKADAPATVSALLSDLLNGYLTADSLNQLVGLITGLLEDIDANLIEAAGRLLDVDINGLKAYKAPEIVATEDKTLTEAFAAELANVLDTYAGGLINWLFFGDDYRFAKKTDLNDTIVINGGYGYEKGLALILEALGADAPTAEKATTANVLGALAARVDEILEKPVDEVVELLPNLIYFLNANGAGVAIGNLLAPVNALLTKLQAFGLNVSLSDLIKFKKADGTEFVLNLEELSLADVVEILEAVLPEFNFAVVEDYLVNFCTGKITKGNYIYRMDAAKSDVVTIILTIALIFVQDEANAAALDKAIGTDIISALDEVFESTPVEYIKPNYNYFNGEINYDEGTIEVIESAITYPNDWTEEKAQYLADNLPALVDIVVGMVSDHDSLAALLKSEVDVFTSKTLDDLVGLITKLLGNVDDKLLSLGVLLKVDLVGLKAYKAPEGIDTVEEFALELANVLNTYAKGVVEWLLLGDDIKLFVNDVDAKGTKLEGTDIITINGAQGYAEGLAPLLEALGCQNLPEVYGVENLKTEDVVVAVLKSVAARIGEIFNSPVERALDILPNLIYFLNANGVAASVNNLAGAFNALALKLKAFGLNITLDDLVNIEELCGIEKDLAIGLDNLTIEAILELVSEITGLNLTVLKDVLTGFALGKVTAYDSVSSFDYTAKMEYADEFDKHDMITVLVTAALLVAVEDEENAAKLDEMIGTEIISALKDVFADVEIIYTVPDWDYPLADNGTVDAMKYAITYPNNWNEATAQYVTDNLPELADLVASLIDSNYDSLSALLNDKVNVFTSENLQAVVDLLANLLKDIDNGLLDAAGVLLGADVVGLKAYKAPEGITTVDAFASELANVLNTYAKGLVEWFLLGNDYRFFVKDVDDNDLPVDFIVINGAQGYAEGLALLLEALGCENLPTVYGAETTTEEIVSGVLNSLAARIDEILENPVEEVIALLPNLLYFLNTNGVAAVVDNTLAAITVLLTKLEALGVNVDINELVNLQKLMNIEGKGATIDLDHLAMKDILQAVSLMTGLDLTKLENVLVGFGLGQVNEYDSVSISVAKKMTYVDEFDKYDMVTVLANLIVLTLADSANKDFVEDLVGEDAYKVIDYIFNKGVVPADIQEFDWKFVDKADTGYAFSAIESSKLYLTNHKYGPLYTEEMAQYIADNVGDFINNIIYLLGININGVSIDNLNELIDELINGGLYNSKNVIAIRDALAGVLDGIVNLEAKGKNVGKHIAAVLKTAGIADIAAVAKVEVPEFTDDRAQFVASLCDVLEPLYGVLKWVLADEDIALLAKEGANGPVDAIKLEGAEGYAYGIIPLLETLECDNVMTPADYYAAVEANGDVLLTSILNPLLDRVDEIMVDPAEEILSMLPNLIYFINSNGVDTVVKNTLNAVYALLDAIEPIAKIDLYEIIGLDLSTLTFEKLFEMLLDMIADATGYRFENLNASAVSELTIGTLVSYESANGKTAYRMIYQSEEAKTEMVTVVMRLIVTFIMHENNQEILLGLLRDHLGMTADAEKYVRGVLDTIATCATETYLGMDKALATLYYLFYGADLGVGETAGGLKDINAQWQQILKDLGMSDDPNEQTIGNLLAQFLDTNFEDILTSEGIAPNGLIAFFQRIIEWFNKIIEWFKNLFN